jgi:hypothetical protein
MPDIFDQVADKKPAKADIFDQVASAATSQPPVPQAPPAPMTGGPIDPMSGLSMRQVQQQYPHPGNVLPYIGGGVGGAIGGPAGAALGGIAGEGLRQLTEPSANPPKEMLKSGVEQGAYELGGKALSYLGGKIIPSNVKQWAGGLLRGQIDAAGQAIDRYLQSPHLAGTTVDVATPLNQMLNKEAAGARKAGADSLYNRIRDLQNTWNNNFNLVNPSPLEASQFRRAIGDFTTFGGEANKTSLNKIQRQVVGIVGDAIESKAPGVASLNKEYANLMSLQTAVKSGAKSATEGMKGGALALASIGLRNAGAVVPTAGRAAGFATEGDQPRQFPWEK